MPEPLITIERQLSAAGIATAEEIAAFLEQAIDN